MTLGSGGRLDVRIAVAQGPGRYWDEWNLAARANRLPATSARQGVEIESRVAVFARTDLRILDVGCGVGWLCERLSPYGKVTGTDMTQSSLNLARTRVPQAEFICGDFFELDLPARSFDVVTSLEVLSHVADQPAFMQRLASLVAADGMLILTTQNRPVYERWSAVAAPSPSQIRRWVDHRELRALVSAHFEQVGIRSLVPVGDQGLLRIVNSPKLNGVLERFVSERRLEQLKEAAMWGGTLLAEATQLRSPAPTSRMH